MSYAATVYNVMIATPSDVAAERAAIRQVLAEWNAIHSQARQIVLLPLGWESHSSPQMGRHPQKILNDQIVSRSDLVVGVFWTRIGTETPTHLSGTVEEIEEHIEAGKPVMLYFSNQPVRLDSVDSEQYQRLLAFKKSCKERGLLDEYGDISEFRDKLFRQLQLKLNDRTYFEGSLVVTEVVASQNSPVSLSAEAKALLTAAAADDGVVMRLAYLSGMSVQAGGKNFIDGNGRRAEARWEAAVDELEREALIEDKAGKGEVFFMTNEGFRVADAIPKSG